MKINTLGKKRNHQQIAKRESCIFQGPLHQRPLRTWSRSQQGEDQQTTNVLLTLFYITLLFQVAIIDNSVEAFAFQLDNGVLIEDFLGSREDTALLRLTLEKVVHDDPLKIDRMQEFLVKLAKAKDARQAVHDYYDQL